MTESSAEVALRPLHVSRSFSAHRVGSLDPTSSGSEVELVKALSVGEGTCVVRLRKRDDRLTIRASGESAAAIVDELARAASVSDGYEAFAPESPLVARLHRERYGLRFFRVPWAFDLACAAVLQQRVTWREAARSWRKIALKYGRSAGGELVAFPGAHAVAAMASWQLEEQHVDPKRARAMIVLAKEVVRRDIFSQPDNATVRKLLLATRGIGPWTTEMVMSLGMGDPDAVVTGDLHLPHLVSWALAREARGSDQRMLELLEPFRGHRQRVVRLLSDAGITVPPR